MTKSALLFGLLLSAGAATAEVNLDWTDQSIYFVIPDRFDNGDPSNDRAGDTGEKTEDILRHGFYPAHKQYRHGGDIPGITKRLPYLQDLGVNAIWLTPVFKNKPVQANPIASSEDDTLTLSYASYHGYWISDFTKIDPHLGTNDDLKTLITEAHKRGMKVYFDVIVNHTSDVIQYRECPQPCLYKGPSKFPYNTKQKRSGPAINRGFIDGLWTAENFTRLVNPDWAYTPYIPTGEENVKVPAWLNDPLLYHNRANTTWVVDDGDDKLGDFLGLDDLFTENPKVVDGMIDIYKFWIREFKIDGFRLDTVKHVNPEFWQRFVPAIEQYAHEQGIPNFYMFGEVFWFDPEQLSFYTKTVPFSAILDFGFHRAAREVFAQSNGTQKLHQFFLQDDFYNGGHSDPRVLTTFLDNHDIGRFSHFVHSDSPHADNKEIMQRTELATAFQMMARGIPVIYYGDEQGFMGTGGDKDARQDMMANAANPYKNDKTILGTDKKPADDHFDPSHPLFKSIKSFIALRNSHRALRRGVVIDRFSEDKAGLYAFSRIDPAERIEYVVVFNNALETKEAQIATYANAGTAFDAIYPADGKAITAAANGKLAVKLPALSFAVYRNPLPIPASTAAPKVKLNYVAGEKSAGQIEICAITDSPILARARFAMKIGKNKEVPIGEDLTPSLVDQSRDVTNCRASGYVYRMWYDGANIPNNTPITLSVALDDYNGHKSQAKVPIVVDNRMKKVIVQYENGNRATSAFALADDAPIVFAEPLKKNQFAFYWPGEAKDVTLFFGAVTASGAHFDKPIQLKFSRDVLANLIEEKNKQPTAKVFVNDAHEVSGENNFAADSDPKPAPFFASAASATPPYGDAKLSLRGEMNNWKADIAMPFNAKLNAYVGTVKLAPGSYRFKFADEAWSDQVNFGGPILKEKGLAIGDGSRALALSVPYDGSGIYRVMFMEAKNDKGEPYRFFRFELTKKGK